MKRVAAPFLAALSSGLLYATFAFCRLRPVYWADVWWHLGTAEWILTHQRIPTADVFSWTAAGAAWINTEWLSELILYGSTRVFGLAGMAVVKTVLMLAAMGFLDRRLRGWGAGVFERLCFLGLAFVGAWPFWVERIDLFSLALVSALLSEIDRLDGAPRLSRRTPVLWVFLFVLWPNVHGAYPLGVLILGLRGLFEIRRSGPLARRLLLGTALCTAATFLNPYGFKLPIEVFRVLSGPLDLVYEWVSPYGPGFLFFYVGVALTVIGFVLKRPASRDDFFAVAVAALFLLYAIRHERFVHFFMICAFPYAARSWLKSRWRESARERWGRWERPALAVSATVLLFTSAASARLIRGGIDAAASGFIPEACDFIDAQKVPGPFYNDYKFGSYLIWRFKGTPGVFQDSRYATVVGYDRLIAGCLQAQRSPVTWKAYVDQWNAQAALVAYPPTAGGVRAAAFDAFFPRTSWGLVYWDDLALLFVRRSRSNAALLRQWEYKAIKPEWTRESYLDGLRRGRLNRRALRRELERNLALNPGCRRARAALHELDHSIQ